MSALGAVEAVGFGVCTGRRGVGEWVVAFGCFAVFAGVETVDGVQEEGGGCSEEDVAGGVEERGVSY